MDTTLVLVLASIVLIGLIILMLYLFRERAEVKISEDRLIMHYPFKTRTYALAQELKNWEVQQAQFIRLGTIYSVVMLFTNGKKLMVNSRLNHENFERIYQYLSSHYAHLQLKDKKR